MKISIITPSFNQGKYIRETIRSVLDQDHHDVEHIVVDGASTDETVNILRSHDHLIWISEPDEGQADALNKGIARSTGDIIGWINSDDYYEPKIFRDVVHHFEDPEIQWIIGNVTLKLDSKNQVIPETSKPISFDALSRNPDILRQQGTFFRKSFLDSVGPFDKSLHLVMDLEMWLRLSKLFQPTMINQTYAYFRLHADQKTSGGHILRQLKEMKMIFRRHGISEWRITILTIRKWLIYAKVLMLAALGKA